MVEVVDLGCRQADQQARTVCSTRWTTRTTGPPTTNARRRGTPVRGGGLARPLDRSAACAKSAVTSGSRGCLRSLGTPAFSGPAPIHRPRPAAPTGLGPDRSGRVSPVRPCHLAGPVPQCLRQPSAPLVLGRPGSVLPAGLGRLPLFGAGRRWLARGEPRTRGPPGRTSASPALRCSPVPVPPRGGDGSCISATPYSPAPRPRGIRPGRWRRQRTRRPRRAAPGSGWAGCLGRGLLPGDPVPVPAAARVSGVCAAGRRGTGAGPKPSFDVI
ncbi:hypothetical protein FHR36_007488 [Kitasatospora paracochleata]|uniref:Uncharacterized protein n=1 Tax=Kitasatospora paracochleata TaxID=58354 RepID=A0ABT1JA06_9ACTN|nr:hypothetical protein [Kitasatospora paracochleata]MCP2314289.1 hypothetical protein [Kitasatospora paracochleata]